MALFNFGLDLLDDEVDMTPVTSSNINAIGFSNGKLYVEFYSGQVYTYYNVDRMIFDEFLNAGSKGRFLWDNIRDVYTYVNYKD